MNQALKNWGSALKKFSLPQWEELPELDLYMDQVITLVERYVSFAVDPKKHALLTSSMVNNYVKQKLVPPPVKKRYTREHLAYLITITLLKQVLALPDIKDLILFQISHESLPQMYNDFCQKQEKAFSLVADVALGHDFPAIQIETIDPDKLSIDGAAYALAAKTLAEKIIDLQSSSLKNT